MKMKSLAMLVVTGLLAVGSLTYIAPAIADEDMGDSNSDQSMPMLSDNSGMTNNANPDANPGAAGNNNPNANNQASNDMGNIGSVSDAGGPDTATGDDDY